MGKYCVKATLASTLAFADENPENLVGDAIVVRRNLIAQGEKEYGNKNRSLLSVKHASLKEVEPVGPLRRLATCCGGTPAKPTVIKTAKPTVAPKKDCELLSGDAYDDYVDLREQRDSLESMKKEFPELKEDWNLACKSENDFVNFLLFKKEITFDGHFFENIKKEDAKKFGELETERNETATEIFNKAKKIITAHNDAALRKTQGQANKYMEDLSASDKNEDSLLKTYLEGFVNNKDEFEKVKAFVEYVNDTYIYINAGETLKKWIKNRSVYKEAATNPKNNEKLREKYDTIVKLVEQKINLIADANDDCNLKTMVNKKEFETLNKELDEMKKKPEGSGLSQFVNTALVTLGLKHKTKTCAEKLVAQSQIGN